MILLGLGSNLGDREKFIRSAIEKLATVQQIQIKKISSLYETEPFGLKEQAGYLNAVIEIWTTLSPRELLAKCLEIENELGRQRIVHWGPRTIDIDLLVFDDVVYTSPDLNLPHPYLALRRFVLVPLAEITDTKILQQYTAKELLAKCQDKGKVELYKSLEG